MIELTQLPECPHRSTDYFGPGRHLCQTPHLSADGEASSAVCINQCHENLRKPGERRLPVAAIPPPPQPKLLGDHVESALSMVGITKERVSDWLGAECNCQERQEKLNALDSWARETVKTAAGAAVGALKSLFGWKVVTPKVTPVTSEVTPQFPVRLDEHNLAVGLKSWRFNSSLMPWKDGYALAWRNSWFNSEIYVSLLDKDFRPIKGTNSYLPLHHREAAIGREDPRLFMFRGQLHVAYVGLIRDRRNRQHRHRTNVVYARLSEDMQVEEIIAPKFPQRNPWEKSWAMFEHEGVLHAVHWINPHRILRIDGENAELIHETRPASNWKWSAEGPRGGASPVRVGNEWYHWFHAFRPGPRRDRVYATGVYTFSAEPPFQVLRMTPEPMIVADARTNTHNWYRDVLFTCGAVRRQDDWVISSGEHDRWTRLDRFSVEEVEAKLQPVKA